MRLWRLSKEYVSQPRAKPESQQEYPTSYQTLLKFCDIPLKGCYPC